jgi:dihydroneopterin aldolase
MGKIYLENIKIYANHGCMEEEAKIGADYRIDLEVEADLSNSSKSDELKDTVDYVLLNTIVKKEMATRSKLLEHVAKRILDSIGQLAKNVVWAKVIVAKIAPPIGGDVEKVSVILEESY